MLNYLLLTLLIGTVASDKRPNFVLILTDDQDQTLGGMIPMKNVIQLIADEGTMFTNSFVTSPICCPSRASLLTGMYVHNHHTRNNSLSGGCYGRAWKELEARTFNVMLQQQGYNTFYAGKYLNQYGVPAAGGPQRVPPGWSEWHGLVGNSVYYDYTISNNGVPTHSTQLYLTDVLRDLSVSFLESQSGAQPFLAVVSPPAPHQPFTAAPRHRGSFANVTAPRWPNFNVSATDKHWLIRMQPSPLPADMGPELDRVFRSRWESLLAVDELVADLVHTLDRLAMLDNTYVIYTSDNGYHMGQFAQMYDKRQPYETDIRVPLMMRGPTVKRKSISDSPVLNIDLAPTILHLAGVEVPGDMDGRSIANEHERCMLVEYHGEGRDGSVDPSCPWIYDSENLAQCLPEYACKCQDSRNNSYACLRHVATASKIDTKFCIFNDDEFFTEFYDLTADPFELDNAADQLLPAVSHWYRLVLSRMLKCKGSINCEHPMGISTIL